MAAPAVSVLMPVRDAALYLDAAIASLIGQSFGEFEIIAVDNGSGDGTPQLLAQWADRDPRVRVDGVGGVSLSSCLNHAAALARAPLLARLDGDDVAEPDRLLAQVAALAANSRLGLIGSAAILIDAAGRKLGEFHPPTEDDALRRRQQASSGFVTSTTMVRKALFDRVGGYRHGLNVSEDFDLWVRISEHCEIANLAEPLVRYRLHGRSVTARQPAQMAIASLCITAAAEARRRSLPEPFSRGVPNLRLALALLGTSRRQARRTVRLRSAVTRALRHASSLPIPAAIKTAAPRLARRLGIRAIYDRFLRSAHLASRARRR